MTAHELAKALLELPDYNVRFATGRRLFDLLSVYDDGNKALVWIDIEET